MSGCQYRIWDLGAIPPIFRDIEELGEPRRDYFLCGAFCVREGRKFLWTRDFCPLLSRFPAIDDNILAWTVCIEWIKIKITGYTSVRVQRFTPDGRGYPAY